jgi:hypothetical protein
LNLAGTYILEATGGALTPDFSNPFTVAPTIVTGGVKIKRSPLHKVGRRGHVEKMTQTIKITNTSGHAESGPLALYLDGVPAGVSLAHASGSYNGSPFIDFELDGKALPARKTVAVTLDFSVPSSGSVRRETLYNDLVVALGL